MIDRAHALSLLSQCDGAELWSLEYCRAVRVPEPWIQALRDAYESGFQDDSQTIYYLGRPVTQFEGILAVDLAVRLARALGVDVRPILERYGDRAAIVSAIQDALEEG